MKWKLTGLLHLLVMVAYAQSDSATIVPNHISEERFIHINGIEQWITIKGNRTKPAVLFLHGGPGSPLSPYADAIYGQWEKDFILVQWDQRGTGKTYGHQAPEELTPEYLRSNPLTLEQMTADGIELAQYLTKYLGKQKLILFGSSWGSVLGVRMAQKSPELFCAYIGHSQIVNPAASNAFAYAKLLTLAQKDKDQEALNILYSIGKPPYDTAKNTGRFMRLIKKYQQKSVLPAPDAWFVLSPKYDNEKDNRHRSDGDDYSFVYYTGDQHLGIASISATINFFENGLLFPIPVFLLQGEEDIQTPAEINKSYYRKIQAPLKKFILLPNTEHGFNQSVVDAQLKVIKDYIIPSLRNKK